MKTILAVLFIVVTIFFAFENTYAALPTQCPSNLKEAKDYQWDSLSSCTPLQKDNQYQLFKATILSLGNDNITCFLLRTDGQMSCLTKSSASIKPATKYWSHIPPAWVCQSPNLASDCQFQMS